MKKLLHYASALLLAALPAFAQTYTVTPSATTYSGAGGNVTFTVALAYPADVSAVGFSAKPPGAAWKYVTTAGTNVPEVKPNADEVTDPAVPSSAFGFSYQTPPANSASFTFTLNLPAGLTGSQEVTFSGLYRVNGIRTDVTVASVTLTQAPEAPQIVNQPAAVAIASGQNATFTVSASGNPAPTFKWQYSANGTTGWADLANAGRVSGATSASLTITGALAADAGFYRAIATNGISPDATSSAALLTITQAPAIVTHPRSQAVSAGASLVLTVVASGSPAPAIQWKRGSTNLANDSRISGATGTTLTITNFQSGDVGSYSAVASNGIGSPATSNAASITLAPSGLSATHALVTSGGYVAGSTVTITNTVGFTGELASLRWSVLLPTGWTFNSAVNAGSPTVQPSAGDASMIDWIWATAPTSPATFTYTLNVPSGATGPQNIVALAEFTIGETPVQLVASSDPLTINQLTYHTADTNQNSKIDASELTRVIVLYNTRFTNPDTSKVRTGAYREAPTGTTTVDGFSTDPERDSSVTTVTLGRYHAADYNRNGRIEPAELTRLITLYNTRFTNPDSSRVRTGYYRIAPEGTSSVDGFATDAARAP